MTTRFQAIIHPVTHDTLIVADCPSKKGHLGLDVNIAAVITADGVLIVRDHDGGLVPLSMLTPSSPALLKYLGKKLNREARASTPNVDSEQPLGRGRQPVTQQQLSAALLFAGPRWNISKYLDDDTLFLRVNNNIERTKNDIDAWAMHTAMADTHPMFAVGRLWVDRGTNYIVGRHSLEVDVLLEMWFTPKHVLQRYTQYAEGGSQVPCKTLAVSIPLEMWMDKSTAANIEARHQVHRDPARYYDLVKALCVMTKIPYKSFNFIEVVQST